MSQFANSTPHINIDPTFTPSDVDESRSAHINPINPITKIYNVNQMRWCDWPGASLVKEITMEVNGEVIDRVLFRSEQN